MPNWCEYELEVKGNPEDLKKFKNFAKTSEERILDANKFIPYPEWGICNPCIISEDLQDELIYQFECAWSPCSPVIHKMSEMFPSLKFTLKYDEPSCAFRGKEVWKGGIKKTSTYTEY